LFIFLIYYVKLIYLDKLLSAKLQNIGQISFILLPKVC